MHLRLSAWDMQWQVKDLMRSSVVSREDLGSGGSDHHALATIFEVDTGGSLASNALLHGSSP